MQKKNQVEKRNKKVYGVNGDETDEHALDLFADKMLSCLLLGDVNDFNLYICRVSKLLLGIYHEEENKNVLANLHMYGRFGNSISASQQKKIQHVRHRQVCAVNKAYYTFAIHRSSKQLTQAKVRLEWWTD